MGVSFRMDVVLCIIVRVSQAVLWLIDLIVEPLYHDSITQGNRQERDGAKYYHRSAHRVKVWFKATTLTAADHDLSNFLYTHHSYTHPNYILKNDNVTLHSITSDTAIFTESDPQVRAADSKTNPFYWEASYLSAKYLIIVPLKHLHHLAQEAGDPTQGNKRVTLIHMTVRCGSTLVGQVLEAVPGTRLISEPLVLGFACATYYKGVMSFPETARLVDSVFRLLCKTEEGINHVVMKLIPMTSPAIPLLKERYPNIDVIFNTRHIRPTVRSYRKLEKGIMKPAFILSGLWQLLTRPKHHVYVYSLPSFGDLTWWKRMRAIMETVNVTVPWYRQLAIIIVYSYYVPISAFLDNKDIYRTVVLYEDIAQDPKAVVTGLFESLALPVEHLSSALSVLEKDSHRGKFGDRGHAGIENNDTLQAVDDLLLQYEAPLSSSLSMEDWKKLFER